ncbi:cytochrome C oxidase subunit IV family protein [Flavobacterium salilacus subsp. salilacus]|uniref:cytochrome C oxidase subunit IV family protein n=1 Tax=Flavobacterium TaxID=237 RepID=UPI001074AE3B|nr:MULTISPECIES: cytochrome C oxidase subunit IV family protein [Flavobacterium]KAF2519999.1 cytochrome C oxidase subunit IV family protein [Flavobacterium salilacus subsp. salilacus]MBE1614087.1 cytochrome C oxidase subunit IV family protein [Flavobacterium sp. SaA2.13]NDI97826.1 cytochrome C oxidase subunit IV family protein [Flavobacterium salilacus subsp. altitudinum]
MAHSHESNTKRIWVVFGILSVITIVEVIFGILKPDALYRTELFKLNLLNWLFIILTIVKAYYIMWAFMHLEGEKGSLRWSIVAPLVFLIIYLVFILLMEGNYVFEVFHDSHYKWLF